MAFILNQCLEQYRFQYFKLSKSIDLIHGHEPKYIYGYIYGFDILNKKSFNLYASTDANLYKIVKVPTVPWERFVQYVFIITPESFHRQRLLKNV